MTHRVAVLPVILFATGIALVAMLSWSSLLLVAGPLSHIFQRGLEAYFAAFTITLVCLSFVTSLLVGAWNAVEEEPLKHRHFTMRPLFHH